MHKACLDVLDGLRHRRVLRFKLVGLVGKTVGVGDVRLEMVGLRGLCIELGLCRRQRSFSEIEPQSQSDAKQRANHGDGLLFNKVKKLYCGHGFPPLLNFIEIVKTIWLPLASGSMLGIVMAS